MNRKMQKLTTEWLCSLKTHNDLRQPVMCDMSKSMRMSRQEHSLRQVRNTNNTERRIKSDLRSAWINPRPSGVGCSPSQQTTPLKTPCVANLSLAPRSDNRPLSAHIPVNTSFRQASLDNLCCVHPHVFLDPNKVCFRILAVWFLRFVSMWLESFAMFSTCRQSYAM